MATKNNFYVNNAELTDLLTRYFAGDEAGTKEQIGKIFLTIAKRILSKPCFKSYSPDRKDDMISDATYFMLRYIKKYDVTRGNPLAYFSTITFNAYFMALNKQKRRDKMFVSIDYLENMGSESPNE